MTHGTSRGHERGGQGVQTAAFLGGIMRVPPLVVPPAACGCFQDSDISAGTQLLMFTQNAI